MNDETSRSEVLQPTEQQVTSGTVLGYWPGARAANELGYPRSSRALRLCAGGHAFVNQSDHCVNRPSDGWVMALLGANANSTNGKSTVACADFPWP